MCQFSVSTSEIIGKEFNTSCRKLRHGKKEEKEKLKNHTIKYSLRISSRYGYEKVEPKILRAPRDTVD